MKTAVVTGAGGLVGSAAVERLCEDGYKVYGLDNNMRRYFFGKEGDVSDRVGMLMSEYPRAFELRCIDIRDGDAVLDLFVGLGGEVDLVIHAAAQPSHDWAAKEPFVDFAVNAVGTLNMLEAVRKTNKEATFCHVSTSKVYGDNPNRLPLIEQERRLDLAARSKFFDGITPEMSIDNCLHSLFGVSKASGDLLVQEYGRYFDMPTVCFRPGCVTGPAHAGVELHGFLAYLMKCAVIGRPYTVFGYEGKQVRCNIYADDLVAACLAFHESPKSGAVYNIGGGRQSACSMLEAITLSEVISDKRLDYTFDTEARIGDHKWWISDIGLFIQDYPQWYPSLVVEEMLERIFDANVDRWQEEAT